MTTLEKAEMDALGSELLRLAAENTELRREVDDMVQAMVALDSEDEDIAYLRSLVGARPARVAQIEAILAAADAQRQAGDEVRRVAAIVPRDDHACELAESNWRVAARASDEANRVLREGGLMGNMPKKDANDLAVGSGTS